MKCVYFGWHSQFKQFKIQLAGHIQIHGRPNVASRPDIARTCSIHFRVLFPLERSDFRSLGTLNLWWLWSFSDFGALMTFEFSSIPELILPVTKTSIFYSFLLLCSGTAKQKFKNVFSQTIWQNILKAFFCPLQTFILWSSFGVQNAKYSINQALFVVDAVVAVAVVIENERKEEEKVVSNSFSH